MKTKKTATLLLTALSLVFLLSQGDARQDRKKHGDKCSTACRKAIDKALMYLAGQQQEDGGMPAKPALKYVRTDATVTNVMTTAVTGMAFLASGSTTKSGKYRKNLVGIRTYLNAKLKVIQETQPRRVGGGGGPAWSSAVSLLFFTNLYEKTKDKEDKKTVIALVRYLTDCVGTEIKNTCWKKAKDSGTVWYVSGVTALTSLTMIALTHARSVGIEVKGQMFTLAKGYYETILEKNGSFKYDKDNMFPHEPRQGRTIAALLSLMGMGVDVKKDYPKTLEYARKNIDKTMTHHTPSMHTTLCAFTFHGLSKDDAKNYVQAYHNRLLARQNEDGSLDRLWENDKKLFMKPNDTAWGSSYATAHFALILQIPKHKVRFGASKKWY